MEKSENKHDIEKAFLKLSAFFGRKDKEYLIENLGMLVGSGSTIYESLTSIAAEVQTVGVRYAVEQTHERVAEGEKLADALFKTGLIDAHARELIAIGEQSGQLSEMLSMVGVQEEKNRLFKYKIRSAMLYPVFVLTLTFSVGFGIAWFILPRLAVVFDQLDLQLPTVTKWLIALGDILNEHGLIIAPLFFATLFGILFLLFGYSKTKHVGLRLLFVIPGIHKLMQEIEIARFGHILGGLLQSGLSVVVSLGSLREAASLPQYRALYGVLQEKIEEGFSFDKSFNAIRRSEKLIPSPVQQLVISSERSGTLAETLRRIGEHYEEKTEISAKNLSVILEPIMLVIVWGGVVTVALAVMLPIYNLVGGLNVEEQAGNTPAPAVVEPAAEVTQENQESASEEYVPRYVPRYVLLDPDEQGTLNVRSEPESDAEVIDSVLFGEYYEYEDTAEGWYEIVLEDGDTGWISALYATEDENYEPSNE